MSIGKRSKQGDIKLLSGLMFCADCGYKMRLSTARRGRKTGVAEYGSYNCTSNKLFGKICCESHCITQTAIEKIILDDIRSMASLVAADEKSAREKFLARKQQKLAEQKTANSKKLKANQHRIAESEALIQPVYEDKFLGKIPETACVILLEKYEAELKSLKTETAVLTEKLETEKQNVDDVDEFIKRLWKYTDVQALTREMCLELIEYVTVDKLPENKDTLRDIHIFYKFIDKGYTLKQD